MKKKVLFVFGTRPEAIKVAPVIKALAEQPYVFQTVVCSTGQHREMLDQVLTFFGIQPDYELKLMKPNQSLAGLTAAAVASLDAVLQEVQPHAVLVQGDTTSAFVGALAAFYRQIPVGHIEAGLRSGDLYSPFPEEMNRVLIGRIAQWHFTPTITNTEALQSEGITQNIYETGNPVLDALHWAREIIAKKSDFAQGSSLGQLDSSKKFILMTCHRRESFGDALERIFGAVLELMNRYPDLQLIYPVHLNPNVQQVAQRILGQQPNIILCAPLDYPELVWALDHCHFLLTDSGGLQEEGPALGKPVVVLREVTERSEAIEAGRAVLVGANPELILESCTRLLDDEEVYLRMSKPFSPYPDGSASERIRDILAAEIKN